MQKSLILSSFITILYLNACESPKSVTESDEVARYSFDMVTDIKKGNECEQNCAGVELQYPKFLSGDDSSFNLIIKKNIQEEISKYVFDAKKESSTDQLINSFVTHYQEFKNEFPVSKTPWTISINVQVNYTNRYFISLQMDTYAYTGGAHPNSIRRYINIDSKGTLITDLEFFINSEAKIRDLVERKFRAQQGLTNDQSLADAGYQFENDTFTLPNNFGFTKTGMVFYYNAYEVAAYSEGSVELNIPFFDLKGIYKHKTL